MEHVTELVTAVLTGKFDVPAELVTARARFRDLDLDSLSVVELYVTLQEEHGVPLDADTATLDTTVQQLVDTLRQLLPERPDDD